MSELALAAVLAVTILLASTISIELGLSVALIELAAGVAVGNVFTLSIPDWLSFVGSFAGIVLTFLAGTEVDVPQFRREWRASLAIGAASFAAPFAVAMATAYWVAGWTRDQAEIGGLALSTTSLAVVYAVLVETGLNRSVTGKRIMAATFVTDILTVLGLSALFITPNLWVVPFAAASVLAIWGLPRMAPWFFGRYGDRIIEPEIKLVFAVMVFKDFNSLVNVVPRALQSGSGPDITEGNQGYQTDAQLVKAKLIVPLDRYINAYGWRQWYSPSTWSMFRWTDNGVTFGKGPTWGVAQTGQNINVYVNTQKLKQLGFDPSNMGWAPDYWRHYKEQAATDDPHLDPGRSRGGIQELELAVDVMDAIFNDKDETHPVNMPWSGWMNVRPT